MHSIVQTKDAPEAVGTYSQATKAGNTLFLSGQIGLDPQSMELKEGFEAQTHQVFQNLTAVLAAAGADLSHIVKLGVFVTDLSQFATLNQIMSEYFTQPYPARAAVEVSALPKGAVVEMDAVAVLD